MEVVMPYTREDEVVRCHVCGKVYEIGYVSHYEEDHPRDSEGRLWCGCGFGENVHSWEEARTAMVLINGG